MNDTLKKVQKETGIKMGKYDNEKNRLFHQGRAILEMLKIYIKQVEEAGMTNEQFFIDFEDSINELSVKDHTKYIVVDKGIAGLIE